MVESCSGAGTTTTPPTRRWLHGIVLCILSGKIIVVEPEVKMSDSVVEWLKVYFDHQEGSEDALEHVHGVCAELQAA